MDLDAEPVGPICLCEGLPRWILSILCDSLQLCPYLREIPTVQTVQCCWARSHGLFGNLLLLIFIFFVTSQGCGGGYGFHNFSLAPAATSWQLSVALASSTGQKMETTAGLQNKDNLIISCDLQVLPWPFLWVQKARLDSGIPDIWTTLDLSSERRNDLLGFRISASSSSGPLSLKLRDDVGAQESSGNFPGQIQSVGVSK